MNDITPARWHAALLDIAEAARVHLDTAPAQTGRVSEERLRAALARLDDPIAPGIGQP